MIHLLLERSLKPREQQFVNAIMDNLGWKKGEYDTVLSGTLASSGFIKDDVYIVFGGISTGKDKKGDPIYFPWHKWMKHQGAYLIPAAAPGAVLAVPGRFHDFLKSFKKAGDFQRYRAAADNIAKGINTIVVKSLDEFFDIISYHDVFDCDIETRGFNFRDDKILLVGMSYGENNNAVILPADIAETDLGRVRTFFEDPTKTFAWTNGKFDVKFLRHQWNIKARVDADLVLMNYAMDERKGIHSLEFQSEDVLNIDSYKGKIKFESVDMYDPDLIEYLGKDCVYQKRVRAFKEEMLKELEGSTKLYENILIPGSALLADVEMNGIYVDIDYTKKLYKEYDTLLTGANNNIVNLVLKSGFTPEKYVSAVGSKSVPKSFNPGSPKQLSHVLIDLLKLPMYKRSRSTDIKAIGYWLISILKFPASKMDDFDYVEQDKIDAWLASGDDDMRLKKELLYAIVFFRSYAKLKSTYIDTVMEQHTEEDRVHASFNISGTVTGRLSSSGPNLQNIPRLKEIKNMFSSPPGKSLIEVDFSQAELRVLAYLSQDPVMIDNYNRDGDLHDTVASQIYGPNFTKEQRVGAKTINFGLAYGRGVHSVAEQLGSSLPEAQKLMDDWFNNMPVAGEWIRTARKSPYSQDPVTPFGRTRRFGLTTTDNANSNENEAVNFPIQSTASDLTLFSAMEVNKWFADEGLSKDVKIVNIVHDAILVECPDGLVPMIAKKVQYFMEKIPPEKLDMNIPFKADIEYSKTGWGSKKKYKEEEDHA